MLRAPPRSVVTLALLAIALAPMGARAQAIIGAVEGGEFRPFPLAVPALRTGPGSEGLKPTASSMTNLLRKDLELAAVFQLLEPKSFIDTDGVTLSTVKFPDWLNVGAGGLVKAVVKGSGDRLDVELHAFEVATGKEALSKTYVGSKADSRTVVHEMADDLYRAFTGEPGVFRTRIAAVRKVQGEKHIVVMDMDGEGVTQITKGSGLNLLPSWSPDGRSLLFTSYRFDNPDLFEVSVADPSNPKRVSQRPGLNTGGRFSPDGNRIALTLSQDGNSEVYLLDRQGAVSKRLTSGWGIDTSPTWSPDGRSIAFVSSRAGTPQIYVMGVDDDDKNAKRVTFQGTYNQTPAYSPKGTHIAFTARDERNRFDIFLLDLRTSEVKRLTQDQGNNEEPTFAPNGRLIAFTSTRNGSRQVFVTNLDGTKQMQVSSGSETSSPAWGPFVR